MAKTISYLALLLCVLITVCGSTYCQSRNLFPVAVSASWGYADRSGKMVIPPQFEQTFDFHEGLANVRIAGKYGYVDEHGVQVIPPQFDMPSDFSEGLGGVGKEERRGAVMDNPVGGVCK